ncbi:MAG: glutamine--fructose-6-phosphate transaminase (isomerizing) [Candidatus Roizmanbacteria bacterium]|nr:glutamine--fructose-6-phosphate transaminase (isomerizing) [Candidatus Roizmanbacteria bacterium]
MCGIFGYVGKRNDAAQIVLSGLKSLEYRGYDSWGVAVVPTEDPHKKNKIVVKKRIGKIGDATVDELPPSDIGFGHTRWATHGGVTQKNAHPHVDCTHTIALIHNGIIENYDSLKKDLVTRSHRFISETDSEVAVHLIEEFLKKEPFEKAVQKSFLTFQGLNALIALRTGEKKLVAVRNGSPLVVGFGTGENYIASDAAALLPYTKHVYFLEDNDMVIVSDTTVELFDVVSGKKKRIKKQKLTWDVGSSELGSFPHFMLKEIHEQPALMADIAVNGTSSAKKLAHIIKKAYGTYFVGCGTAAYACIAASYLFSKIAKYHINWAVGSEFSYHLDFLTNNSLVVALSQSGETMDILESVKAAKQRGARIASLVNVLGSTLYRESDYPFLIGAGPEKGVASTKAFIGKLSHLILTAYALNGTVSHGSLLLQKASKAGKQIVAKEYVARLKKLVRKIQHAPDIYVIGRGMSYPASLEAALKIKEISYIHAEGLAAGELKHGPLALIEKGTPCIVYAPLDETFGANLAGAMEMRARGGYIIGISPKRHEVFDYYLPIEDVGEASIIPGVMVAQLLAYYLTVEKGYDPDKPRNLAKSVTVK